MIFFMSNNMMNRFLRKCLANHSVPLCQLDKLCFSCLKIKRNLTPFAVVVHLVEVNSGGDFLFAFGLGFAFQSNHMKRPSFCQQTG